MASVIQNPKNSKYVQIKNLKVAWCIKLNRGGLSKVSSDKSFSVRENGVNMLIFIWNFKTSNNNSPIKMSTCTNYLGQVRNKIFDKTSHMQVKIFKKHHKLSLSHNNNMPCTSN